MIRSANISDYEDISKVIKSVFYKPNKKQNGFLMSHISKDKYEELLSKSGKCFVYIEDNNIVGYLFAYPNTLIKPTDEINNYFLETFEDNYIYIYQIAIRAEFQRKGLAKKLYNHLFQQSKNSTIRVISSAEPYNEPSEKFHLSIGFNKIGLINRDDGGSNFVYELKK